MEAIIATLGPAFASAIAQIFLGKQAANQQSDAARAAIAAQLSMFGITQATLAPYLSGGARAMGLLTGVPGHPAIAARPFKLTKGGSTITVNANNMARVNALKAQGYTVSQQGHGAAAALAAKPGALPGLMAPIKVDAAAIQANPAYQFAMSQGLKSTGNALTQRGMSPLGSGAGVKGAEQFAAGLAAQNWQQYFQNALANKEMAWKALYGTASLGESAGTGIGTAASTAGKDIGTNLTNIGTAQSGATRGIADAISGFANSIYTNNLLANSRAGQAIISAPVY